MRIQADPRARRGSAAGKRQEALRSRLVLLGCTVLLAAGVAAEPSAWADTMPRESGYFPYSQSRGVTLPNPLGYVSDHAGILDPVWKARIRSVCQDLERKTGVEMVVVTVRSHAPYGTAQDYGSALYQRWGIGTAQEEHGALVLLVVDSGQATITLGKALLPVVHPVAIQEIGRQYLEPGIRNHRPGEGLYRATVALASVAQDLRVGSGTRTKVRGVGIFLTVTMTLGVLWALWWISRPDLRHPYGRIRRGEFWGSGQGGFGGNFGGYGGGTGGEGFR